MNVFADLIRAFAPSSDGFVFMWAILLMLFLFIALAVREFILFKNYGDVHPEKFLLKIRALIQEKKFEEAIAICKSGGERALPKIVLSALESRDLPPEMMKSNVEEKVVVLSSKLERNINYFATIGNTATLLGLMGTIFGLVLAFAAVGKPDILPFEKTAMLANGISTAMNTTLFGLIIAVPCIWVFSYFSTLSISNVNFFDRQAASILNVLYSSDVKLKNYKPSERRRHKDIETEIDLTAIMGLMVVLIPLLLSSAEFVKIGIIEMNLPKGGKSASAPPPPDEKPLKLDAGLIITDKGITIKSSLDGGGDSSSVTVTDPQVKFINKEYEYAKLASQLSGIKKKVLVEILSRTEEASREELENLSLYDLSVQFAKIDASDLFHYKDFDNLKIVAQNKIEFQKIINIMDASRMYSENGNSVSLFPNVSMGAGIN